MGKFKVGDRVMAKRGVPAWEGMVGTVMGYDSHWMRFSPDVDARYDNGDMVPDQYRQSPYAGMDENDFTLVESVQFAPPAPAIDAHYTKYAIQPMEFSLANGLDAAQHTVVKYTVRWRDKGGIRDLRAAIRVLELMIEREEKAQANG